MLPSVLQSEFLSLLEKKKVNKSLKEAHYQDAQSPETPPQGTEALADTLTPILIDATSEMEPEVIRTVLAALVDNGDDPASRLTAALKSAAGGPRKLRHPKVVDLINWLLDTEPWHDAAERPLQPPLNQ